MPSVQQLYGIDAEIQAKLDSKYSQEDQDKAVQWIEQVTGQKVVTIFPGLKNGVALCMLLNKIRGGTVHSFYPEPKFPLFERENIKNYIDGCSKLGVQQQDLFTISDLHEGKQLSSVLQNLYAVGRQAQVIPSFKGPHFGVKYSVTLEQQKEREEKKRVDQQRQLQYSVQREERQKSRREQVENETKMEHLEHEKKNEDFKLNRQFSKGRITEKEYTLQKQKSEDRFRRLSMDLSQYEINNSEVLYGMDRETHQKMVNKRYSVEVVSQQSELMDWIEVITGEPVDDLHEGLKSGVVLCKLLNNIRPGIIKKIDTRVTSARFGPSVSRDNIKVYLEKCSQIGVPPSDLFNISDLYENKDPEAVIKHLSSMKRKFGDIRHSPAYVPIVSNERSDLSISIEVGPKPTDQIFEKINETTSEAKERVFSFFPKSRKALIVGGLVAVGVVGGIFVWMNYMQNSFWSNSQAQ